VLLENVRWRQLAYLAGSLPSDVFNGATAFEPFSPMPDELAAGASNFSHMSMHQHDVHIMEYPAAAVTSFATLRAAREDARTPHFFANKKDVSANTKANEM